MNNSIKFLIAIILFLTAFIFALISALYEGQFNLNPIFITLLIQLTIYIFIRVSYSLKQSITEKNKIIKSIFEFGLIETIIGPKQIRHLDKLFLSIISFEVIFLIFDLDKINFLKKSYDVVQIVFSVYLVFYLILGGKIRKKKF